MNTNNQKVVVVGAGLAAIYFIYKLNKQINVWWIHDLAPQYSNSYLAKGGMAISFANDCMAHVTDTLLAGGGLCNRAVVNEIVYASESLFNQIAQDGFIFDKGSKLEGGHQRPRVKFSKDRTGKFLVDFYLSQILARKNVWQISNAVVVNFVPHQANHLHGLQVVSKTDGTSFYLNAEQVVFACGGMSGLFLNSTANKGAQGLGLGLLLKAGLMARDLAFMQFHPTLLYQKAHTAHHLITEALRGAGAKILNHKGEEFIAKQHPLASLAPRDFVSQAMFREMQDNTLSHLWLDKSKVKDFAFHFPYLHQLFKKHHLLNTNPIPICPGAHYQCGGIVSLTNGKTAIEGVWVLGEIACTGLHGANRLASNSLLELIYMANAAANYFNENFQFGEITFKELNAWDIKESKSLQIKTQTIKQILWSCYGILRQPVGMERGLTKLKEMEFSSQQYKLKNNLANQLFALKLRAGIALATDALSIPESIGAHQLVQTA